jgi:DNA-binding NarL/FixJ family response regulator
MRLGVISRLSLCRKGLCALLASSKNCSIVLELPNVPEDVEILRRAQPDVLLFQTGSHSSEFAVVSRLRNLAPEIKVLLILDTSDEEAEIEAIRAGGRGCVSNASDLETLLKAIGAAVQGEIWVSRRVASRLISKLLDSGTLDSLNTSGLTPQEWKVLGLLATGSRNKEIAQRLSVSENTVKTHLYTIYRKINVDCRLAATLYYFQHARSNGKCSPQSAIFQAELNTDVVPSHEDDPLTQE